MNDPAAVINDGRALFERLNQALRTVMRQCGHVPIDQAITIVSRELNPYLRNRFEVRDLSDPVDRRRRQMRLGFFDHAIGCRAGPDLVVDCFHSIQNPPECHAAPPSAAGYRPMELYR